MLNAAPNSSSCITKSVLLSNARFAASLFYKGNVLITATKKTGCDPYDQTLRKDQHSEMIMQFVSFV